MSSMIAKEIGDASFSLTYMTFNEEKYHDQLREKTARTAALFDLPLDRIEILDSPTKNFRNRVRFAVVEEEGNIDAKPYPEIRYAKFECGSPSVLVTSFPIACLLTNRAMKTLPPLLAQRAMVMQRPKAVHFLTSTTQECIVITLIYNRPLDDISWTQEAEALRDQIATELCLNAQEVSIIAKTKGVKLGVGCTFVTERFLLPGILHCVLLGIRN
jgi:tRNA/tmRNA/rRNA uracil-C5-methylase (TrmA/RlmC/RlmD family)